MNKTIKPPILDKLIRQNINDNDASRFSLELKRTVNLKRYPMIAQLAFLRERPDLVALLKEMQNSHTKMPERLICYLTKEKLWDQTNAALTDLGEKVKVSGCFNTWERGFYHIWFTDNDPLFGTIPVYIQRDHAFFEPKKNIWKKETDAKNSQFKYDNSTQPLSVQVLEEKLQSPSSDLKPSSLSLSTLIPEVICPWENEKTVQLNWQLGFSTSLLKLQGRIETLQFEKNREVSQSLNTLDISFQGFGAHFADVMEAIAEQYNGVWHQDSQRVAVELETIKQNKHAVQRFVLAKDSQSNLKLATGKFDQCKVSNLPIQPKDQRDAIAWHHYWLNNYYQDSYQSSASAHKQQATWLDHDALQPYKLSLYHPQNLLAKLSRYNQLKAYWHAAALADLTPSNSKKLQLPISLVEGDPLNLKDLIHQLSGNEYVETMIYSDRYVYTRQQRRNLAAVARCFDNAQGRLLTLKHENKNTFKLPNNWTKKVFEKKNDNHGRFWIFISQHQVSCWECTSGLDFFKRHEDSYLIDGYPTFIPKHPSELPPFLRSTLASTATKRQSMEIIE